MNRYEIIWERDISGECSENDMDMAIVFNGSNTHIIYGLEENSSYSITVTATNAAGSEVSDPVSGITKEAGSKWKEKMYHRSKNTLIYNTLHFLSVPSGHPINITTSDVISSSITIEWGPVNCIQRNGDITGYLLRYTAEESGIILNVSVSGGDTTKATISGLYAATTYSIEVAAVNGVGIGVYSAESIVITIGTYNANILLHSYRHFIIK